MNWVLVITVLVNGQVFHPDKVKFKTQEECLRVLHAAEQHPQFKAYGAKAVCEKQ